LNPQKDLKFLNKKIQKLKFKNLSLRENEKTCQPYTSPSMEELAPETEPSYAFPTQVRFDPKLPQFELVRKGFCQLILTSFKQLYGLLQKDFKLPELKPCSLK